MGYVCTIYILSLSHKIMFLFSASSSPLMLLACWLCTFAKMLMLQKLTSVFLQTPPFIIIRGILAAWYFHQSLHNTRIKHNSIKTSKKELWRLLKTEQAKTSPCQRTQQMASAQGVAKSFL